MFFESFLLNLIVIVVLIFALIFDYVTKFFSYWYVRHISYKYPVPFIGSDYHRVFGLRSTTDEVEHLCQKYGKKKLVGTVRSRIPDLIVKDAEIIKTMMSEPDFFNSRGLSLEKSQDPCLRSNLFYAEGRKWDLLKTNLESTLDSKTRKFEQCEGSTDQDKYLPDANGEINVQNFLENIMDGVIKDLVFGEAGTEGESIVSDLRSELSSLTIASKLKSYLKSIFPSIYILFGLNTLSSQPNRRTRQILEHSNLLEETRKMSFEFSPENKDLKRGDQGNSQTDIAFSLLCSFITEGYVPCLNTITCLLYELAKDQGIQDKARSPTKSCLENIIKETLRLYPSYSIVTRKCIKTFKFPESDLLIDKGVTITVPIAHIHKDPKYYEDPEVFNPNRFTEELEKSRPEFSYLPYGVGSRKCIGQKLSQVIMMRVAESILRKYQVLPSSKTPSSLVFEDHNFQRVLSSKVWLQVKPIKS